MSDHRLHIPRLDGSKSLNMHAADALRPAVVCMDIYAAGAEQLLDKLEGCITDQRRIISIVQMRDADGSDHLVRKDDTVSIN